MGNPQNGRIPWFIRFCQWLAPDDEVHPVEQDRRDFHYMLYESMREPGKVVKGGRYEGAFTLTEDAEGIIQSGARGGREEHLGR